MILPMDELKDFSYYKSEFKSTHDRAWYRVTLYYKKKKFLKYFEYRPTKVFNFRCRVNKNREAEASQDYKEFRDQLQQISLDKWTFIPTEVYENIQKEHPELLL